MTVYVDCQKFILWVLPPGKPDFRENYTPETQNQRQRVLQKGQKELTCWYAALNHIRLRIGPNHPSEYKERRTFEQRASRWRKRQSQIDLEHERSAEEVKGFRGHQKSVKHNYITQSIVNAKNFLGQTSSSEKENQNATLQNRFQTLMQLQNRCFQRCVKEYGLGQAKWRPWQKIDVLISHLEDYGPHVIKGFFGREFYPKEPEKFEILYNFQVFC